MAHHICPHAQIVVKRLQSVQFRRRGSGEIITDPAEDNLDEKSLMSVSHDGASSQRSGINRLERPSPETGTRIRDKLGQNQAELLNENNHRKRKQYND